jgi:hydrogenase nickel incorporation protein HypB
MEIKVLKDIFESNKEMAKEIKELLREKEIYMVDMMSSPGSGKTTITDGIISSLKNKYRIGIIEGDIETMKDAEKLAKHDIPIIQIETSRFGGDCHLESSWIKKCLVVVLSVTEGEDKPVKYPLMFNTSQTLIINKIDLLPYLQYDINELMSNVKRVNPTINVFSMSATTGEGLKEFISHLDEKVRSKVRRGEGRGLIR